MDDTDENRRAFGELIGAMIASMGREASKPMLLGYWMVLRPLQLEDVRRAVLRAMERPGRHPPTPGELRQLAGVLDDETRAVLAWGAVRGSIGRVGAYRSVEFDDPFANAAIRNLGGWERLCSLPGEELEKWYRREFEKTYLTLRAFDSLAPEAGKYLPGIHEKAAEGWAVDPPVRIACHTHPTKQQLTTAEESKELAAWNQSSPSR